jgi:hypothetical protein
MNRAKTMGRFSDEREYPLPSCQADKRRRAQALRRDT